MKSILVTIAILALLAPAIVGAETVNLIYHTYICDYVPKINKDYCRTVYEICESGFDDKKLIIIYTDIKKDREKEYKDKIEDLSSEKIIIDYISGDCYTVELTAYKNPLVDVDNVLCYKNNCHYEYAQWNGSYDYRNPIYGNISVLSGPTFGYFPVNISLNDSLELFWINESINATNESIVAYVYWNDYTDYIGVSKDESTALVTIIDEGNGSDSGLIDPSVLTFITFNNISINDHSSFKNNGILTGSGYSEIVPGITGNGLDFNGSGRYIDTTQDIGDSPSGSVMLWFKPNENYQNGISGTFKTFLFKGYAGNDQILLRYNGDGSGTLGFYINDGSYHGITYATTLLAGSWYHIAATWSPSNMDLYLNGINVSQGSGYIPQSGNDGWMTNSPDDSTYNNGTFDNIIIFNKTLTADDVSFYYYSQLNYGLVGSVEVLPTPPPPPPDSSMRWCYDETHLMVRTVENKTVNGNNTFTITDETLYCSNGCEENLTIYGADCVPLQIYVDAITIISFTIGILLLFYIPHKLNRGNKKKKKKRFF